MTHQPTSSPAAEAVVASHGLRAEVALWAPERILSALGHPGYGRAYARKVIAKMTAHGLDAHEAIYGLRPQ